jgi:hypothetical protein
LWRKKEAFSDGVSCESKSWYQIIQDQVALTMSDEYFESNRLKYEGFLVPHTKEALYYPIATKKIVVDSSITNLAQFAKSQGVNYKILKLHNPWLRDKMLLNTTGKKYEIEIPTTGYTK